MGRAAFIAFTRRGCALAARLASELPSCKEYAGWACCVSGPARFAQGLDIDAYESLEAWTATWFARADALVFVGAAGIAVRAIAPHVNDKVTDPAVVCVDESGGFAVPLLSGHVGGANALARAVARLCGGHAAISTATDVNGVFAVDAWAVTQGLSIVERNLVKRVSSALLDGEPVGFVHDGSFAGDAPAGLTDGNADLGICVSEDVSAQPFPETLHLVPRAFTVGVGCRRGTSLAVLAQAVDRALAGAGISTHAVAALASIDVKCDEPAIAQLAANRGWETRFYPAEALAQVPGAFSSSAFVERTVGVDNVCERAACAAGGKLVVCKQSGDGVAVAIARHDANPASLGRAGGARLAGAGVLYVVGLGPGGAGDLSGRARAAIASSEVVVGYPVYVDLLRREYPGKEYFTTPMRQEVERCRHALEEAVAGRRVAVVCSGDAGVYGMAGLVFELACEYAPVPIEVVPGISASNGGAAILGAPLMHDHCIISLSDLLTPWELIERRLRAAAQADFVICLYNPSSRKRHDYLRRACDIVLEHRNPDTVCGIARNIGREGESSQVLTLQELRDTAVDMFTTVFIGNSQTQVIGGNMVTPRGYLQREVRGE